MAKAKYQRTSELMGVELAYLLDRKPRTLSGGEKQRVALGRCITRDPALFLLTSPSPIWIKRCGRNTASI